MKKSNVRIALTSGDQDGVGPEVTAKALYQVGPQKGVHFFLWRSPVFPKKYLRLLDKKFKRKTFSTWAEAFKYSVQNHKELIDINSLAPPPQWIEAAAEAGNFGHIQAMVTAPLSKTLIAESGLKDIGHTEILSRICGRKTLFMAFIGKKFNVLLTTGHIPLETIPQKLTSDLLKTSLKAAASLNSFLEPSRSKKTVALVGLNPHAGEKGLIGHIEEDIFTPALKELATTENVKISGPLVPDAAFLPSNWNKYSLYVCPYHDQGLIPFKLVHEHKSGCHMTMGLPFIRTSVEHGTAKDLFGKNKADPSSMKEAIRWAVTLSQKNFKADQFLMENKRA